MRTSIVEVMELQSLNCLVKLLILTFLLLFYIATLNYFIEGKSSYFETIYLVKFYIYSIYMY